MAKYTLNIEGDPKELSDIMRKLMEGAEGTDAGESSPTEGATGPTTDGKVPWTKSELQELWNRIKPNARRILAEIARHPDGISFSELQKRVRMEPLTVAGSMSSVGFAMRRFPNKPWTHTSSDASGQYGQYRMDPEVAKMILELDSRT